MLSVRLLRVPAISALATCVPGKSPTSFTILRPARRLLSLNSARPCHRPVTPTGTRLLATSTTMLSNSAAGNDMLNHFLQERKVTLDSLQGQNIAVAMQALARADCVCFDVDSTVVNEEGIDVLADYLGKGEEVAAMTKQAMEGGMKFQDALSARLSLLQPSKASIQACLRDRPLQLTPGVKQFIEQLHQAKKDVYLVSGGFRIMIEPVADQVGIDRLRIYANTLVFDATTGHYQTFDPQEPTSRDMGKPEALRRIQAAGGYQCMIMIGDGATDAQAKPPAEAFIGFGGVVVRTKVQQMADWFVTDFADLSFIVKTLGSSGPSR